MSIHLTGKKSTNGQKAYEKKPNILSYQGNAKQLK
jgi:hypothetical protein